MGSNSAGGEIYGPILIGTLLNCMLYGATVVQAYVYFQTYKGDKRWIKMFVLYILFFETVNTASDIAVIYEPLIIRFGSPHVLQVAPLLLPANPVSTASVMISFPVQLFIAWRLKKMSNSNVLPLIISCFAFSSFVGGILISALLIHIDFQYSGFQRNDPAVVLWLASAAVADAIITASLVYSLLRKRTGFPATSDAINRIIKITIQTGMMTTIFAILDVMLFTLAKEKTWNFILDFPLSKLYSNTILSTLNARQGWKSIGTVRDNVLFGSGNGVQLNVLKGPSQIESGTGDVPAQQISIAVPVPMNVLESGSSQACDPGDTTSAVNIMHKCAHAI